MGVVSLAGRLGSPVFEQRVLDAMGRQNPEVTLEWAADLGGDLGRGGHQARAQLMAEEGSRRGEKVGAPEEGLAGLMIVSLTLGLSSGGSG